MLGSVYTNLALAPALAPRDPSSTAHLEHDSEVSIWQSHSSLNFSSGCVGSHHRAPWTFLNYRHTCISVRIILRNVVIVLFGFSQVCSLTPMETHWLRGKKKIHIPSQVYDSFCCLTFCCLFYKSNNCGARIILRICWDVLWFHIMIHAATSGMFSPYNILASCQMAPSPHPSTLPPGMTPSVQLGLTLWRELAPLWSNFITIYTDLFLPTRSMLIWRSHAIETPKSTSFLLWLHFFLFASQHTAGHIAGLNKQV